MRTIENPLSDLEFRAFLAALEELAAEVNATKATEAEAQREEEVS